MPEFTPITVVCIILLGGAIGFLSGLFGVGGGFLLTPLLNIAFGIPFRIAVGSGLCAMIGTGTTAMLRHWKNSAVDVKLALIMLGGIIVGSNVGARLLVDLDLLGDVCVLGAAVPWAWLIPMGAFVVLLVVIGVGTFRESLATHRKTRRNETVQRRVGRGLFNRRQLPPMVRFAATEGKPTALLPIVYLALLVGLLNSFLGLGGGVIIVPALIYWVGSSTRLAGGTSLLLIVLSALSGTVSHALLGDVHLPLVLLLLVSSTAGASFGAVVHHRMKAHTIRLYLSYILFLALAIILVKILQRLNVLDLLGLSW
ncbi:MAG TPA: sulfite exporter TauE/SafE family protein [Planctomycetota bacterium]|nr:sulfite exporter TauE/SafE family protein [Planctomycetota bacterium]